MRIMEEVYVWDLIYVSVIRGICRQIVQNVSKNSENFFYPLKNNYLEKKCFCNVGEKKISNKFTLKKCFHV